MSKITIVKLFKFSLPNIKEVIYLYSSIYEENYLRRQLHHQDSGDIDFSLFSKLYRCGIINQISDVNQVPRDEENDSPLYKGGEQWWLPYTSDELDPNMWMTIIEFFNKFPNGEYIATANQLEEGLN